MAADTTIHPKQARRSSKRWQGMDDAVLPSTKTGAAFRAAQRHSRRVRVLRTALPFAAVVCIAVFSWYTFLSTPASVNISMSGAGIKDGKLVMTNPKLSGFTGANQPYSMAAARAIQDIGNTSVFKLEDIHASLPLSEHQTAKVDAGTGVYDNTKRTLALGAGVTVRTSEGAVARLRSAAIDIASGQMRTDEPVEIDNGDTQLSAASMSVSKNDGVIVFDKQVSLVLQPAALHNSTSTNGGN
jgi:lipopolysaccharide export system protein LptC